MPDGYQLPAIVLTALLLPAFAQLYLRSRDKRTLLWLLGFFFACLRMLQVYRPRPWDFSSATEHPWIAPPASTAALIGAILFLAPSSPLAFRLGSRRIPYAVPFTIPLVVYAILMDGVYHGQCPPASSFSSSRHSARSRFLSAASGPFPSGSMPTWLGLSLCIAMGGLSLWICVSVRGSWPLVFVESALHLTTALLIFYVFRRVSPGIASQRASAFSPGLSTVAHRARLLSASSGICCLHLHASSAMGKVVAAVGMILLAWKTDSSQAGRPRPRTPRAQGAGGLYQGRSFPPPSRRL